MTDDLFPYDDQAARNAKLASMAAEGYIIDVCPPGELFIDLDSQPALDQFWKLLEILGDRFPDFLRVPHNTLLTPSKSGQGWHARVRLANPLARHDVLQMQSLLGSDPIRELLNWWRHMEGFDWEQNNILIETADAMLAIKGWRERNS